MGKIVLDPVKMYMTPWIDGPLTKLWAPMDFQSDPHCAQFERRLVDCLEAYGRYHWDMKCRDYLDDFRECTLRLKQNMRVRLMRMERQRQYRAGERSTQYAPGPAEDAF